MKAITNGRSRGRRYAAITVVIICIPFGGLFFLQGIGVIGGSVMTGDRLWLLVGLVMLLIGLVLLSSGACRRARRT